MAPKEVLIFDEKVKLDKLLIVTLDGEFDKKMSNGELELNLSYLSCQPLKNYAFNYKDLCEFIKQRDKLIITPLTKFVNASIMELGYEIIAQSGAKYIVFSDLLMGNSVNGFGREIRVSQNWEKMLYSGCFDLNIPNIRNKEELI